MFVLINSFIFVLIKSPMQTHIFTKKIEFKDILAMLPDNFRFVAGSSNQVTLYFDNPIRLERFANFIKRLYECEKLDLFCKEVNP